MTAEMPAEAAYCSYDEFGRRFFAYAVNERRILGAVGDLAGSPISFGPIGAGPGRIAKVTAEGQIGAASVKRRLDGLPEVAFDLAVPVDLELHVDLGVDRQRFDAHADVRLRLTARAAEPLQVVIDIDPPTTDDVDVVVRADGLRASLLQHVSGMDSEIQRFIVGYVAREIDKPHVRRARRIDVAARMEAAWPT
ncbi:MAG TPA: hypothetical protein VEX15_02620 [Nocardioidaceae bacterium]|nr:hypothetical protein [Nocardioidaceae bacterium]